MNAFDKTITYKGTSKTINDDYWEREIAPIITLYGILQRIDWNYLCIEKISPSQCKEISMLEILRPKKVSGYLMNLTHKQF